MKDKAASVRQRLHNLSRKTGEDFQLLLTRYAVERLLNRLSRSSYANRFLFQGAMLFALWTGRMHRPTRDLDPGSGQRKVGVRAADASAEFHCDGNKSTYEKMAWVMYTWEFTAVASETTLEIHTLDNTDPLRGAVVDNVSVVLNEW